ncbi:MAG: SLC13 family permease [Nitriliruptorales bacterium]|nr:SLC13 family permease [Nitriliruptorales bacterium]
MDVWLTLAVLAVLLTALIRELASPAANVLGAVLVLVVLDVLDPAAAFAGFANPATITVAGLFVVARAVQEHGGVEEWLARLLDRDRPRRLTLGRLVAPLVGASSIIANTPLVAAVAPMIRDWAERRGIPASRLLIPTSYAAILGGTITTIGTSVTLLVSGLVAQQTGEGFGFLEVTPVGLPVAVAAGVMLVLTAPRTLPNRQTIEQQVAARERDYSFRLHVEPDGELDGKTVAEAGLRNLVDTYLARIDRDGLVIAPVPPDQELEGDDELLFVGRASAAKELVQRTGLEHSEAQQLTHLTEDHRGLYEAIVAKGSPLSHRTLKAVSFRGRYDGAVLAIHRAGERLDQRLGTVPLEPGDTLLIQADRSFADRWRNHGDFAVVVPLDEHGAGGTSRRPLVLAVVAAMVLVAALGWLPIVTAVLLACAVLIATRTLDFFDAKDAIDLDVVLIIGGAIGLGAAVQSSGLAAQIAEGIAATGAAFGAYAALAAVLVGTMVLTELVTNAAAAALMVPVALDVATRVGADERGFAVAVAVAASSSFLTPIGYQTNTIVYGLGGYKFGDYFRAGWPITLTVVTTALLVIPLVWS